MRFETVFSRELQELNSVFIPDIDLLVEYENQLRYRYKAFGSFLPSAFKNVLCTVRLITGNFFAASFV